jgi:predicted nucleotide-binding protein
MPIDPATLQQINHAIFDLQSSDHNNFVKHIKKLSRLLHSTGLGPITDALTVGIDLDPWIEAGAATGRQMAGTAKLDWPDDPEKDLGYHISLIDLFAEKGYDFIISFSMTFFLKGSNLDDNLHNMTRQMLVPFGRDYIDYVKAKVGTVKAAAPSARTGPPPRKIFIVHGHDEGPKYAVTRFVERLGFEAIILHEQASQGKTVIEKIEAHADVGFAIVLLTPDDFGGAQGEDRKNRARQNVILELGFFVGKLTRSRVCALKRGDIEVPSDFGGVVYVTYDENGGWQKALGAELEAAGFDVDWKQVMRSS